VKARTLEAPISRIGGVGRRAPPIGRLEVRGAPPLVSIVHIEHLGRLRCERDRKRVAAECEAFRERAASERTRAILSGLAGTPAPDTAAKADLAERRSTRAPNAES
jgi:hypothetical protein